MTKKHVHQYYKTYPYGPGVGALKGRHQWECAIPDCTHYIPKNVNGGSAVGRTSVCNNCSVHFILDDDNTKEDRPRCDECRFPSDIVIPPDINWERIETRGFIAKKRECELSEVTEEDIDRYIEMKKLQMGK